MCGDWESHNGNLLFLPDEHQAFEISEKSYKMMTELHHSLKYKASGAGSFMHLIYHVKVTYLKI